MASFLHLLDGSFDLLFLIVMSVIPSFSTDRDCAMLAQMDEFAMRTFPSSGHLTKPGPEKVLDEIANFPRHN